VFIEHVDILGLGYTDVSSITLTIVHNSYL